jgi:hypothetical protein
MKPIILLMTLLSLPLAAGSVFGQEPGDIGVFFDAGGTQTARSIVAGVPFDIYVVAFEIPIGILSHEGSIQRDPAHLLLGNQFYPPSSFNLGTPENWIVGTGICFPIFGPTVIQTLQYVSFAASLEDQLFCIGPSTPSSFSPAAPGYGDCADVHLPFGLAASGNGLYPDGCAVGNPTELPPISTEQQRWGEVKALFR